MGKGPDGTRDVKGFTYVKSHEKGPDGLDMVSKKRVFTGAT
jgi:hypothetical protein